MAYVFARWKRLKVAPDYPVEIEDSYHSAPFRLICETVDVRVAERTVEVFHRGRYVTSRALSPIMAAKASMVRRFEHCGGRSVDTGTCHRAQC